jgi:hypothetical protein
VHVVVVLVFGHDGTGQERFPTAVSGSHGSVVEGGMRGDGGKRRYLIVWRFVGFCTKFIVVKRNCGSIRHIKDLE